MTGPFYLDHAASSLIDPRAAEAAAAISAMPGNPSSVHSFGRTLRTEIDRSRALLGRLLGVAPSTVTFTSGATEANALALLGTVRPLLRAHAGRRLRVIAGPIEHASVRGSLAMLEQEGVEVFWLPVGRDGIVSSADVAAAITPEAVLVSVMWVNNVLGTVQPVAEIGRAVADARARRGAADLPIIFHCDAVQAMTTQAVDPRSAGIDLLTLSGHKIHGPKGIGALVRPSGAAISPVTAGGGQESGARSGTENAAGIAGFGRAAEILEAERGNDVVRIRALGEAFIGALAARLPSAEVLCDGPARAPHIMFIRLPGMPGDRLAMELDAAGFAVSAGSACDGGNRRPSHVLAAVFDGSRASHGGVRVSLGRFTEERELLPLVDALARIAGR